MATQVNYVEQINDSLEELTKQGWQHGSRTIGLLEAITLIPQHKLETRPSGKPSSRTPLSRQDTLRLDAESIIRSAHDTAQDELTGTVVRLSISRCAQRLGELAPLLSRPTQKRIAKSLNALVDRILIGLGEKRPALRIRDRGTFCPRHEGERPPLFLMPFENEDLAVVACFACGERWPAESMRWLGTMIEAERTAELVSA